jgi:hypothetical protein
MKELKVFSFCCIFALLQMAFATEVTVTLQNGLNGYEGCADAYVDNASYTNNGASEKLECKYDICVS